MNDDVKAQLRPPNYRLWRGTIFLARCFVCDPRDGRENHHAAAWTGTCSTCGWREPGSAFPAAPPPDQE